MVSSMKGRVGSTASESLSNDMFRCSDNGYKHGRRQKEASDIDTLK